MLTVTRKRNLTIKATGLAFAAVFSTVAAVACTSAGAARGASAATSLAAHAIAHMPSWRTAQRVAGFPLTQPRATLGLDLAGISVAAQCTGKMRLVDAYYQDPHKYLHFFQTNSRSMCFPMEYPATRLATVWVNGVRASLAGWCGHAVPGEGPCRSHNYTLLLTWTRGGITLEEQSYGNSVRQLVSFADGLRPTA